jgi:hypothetical protein
MLNACSKINNIHVCPGLGIIKKNAEDSSCLYSQKYNKVKAFCDMDVMPSYELAVPLYDNHFLIHSMTEQCAILQCPRRKQEKITVEPGITQHKIPSGLQADAWFSNRKVSTPRSICVSQPMSDIINGPSPRSPNSRSLTLTSKKPKPSNPSHEEAPSALVMWSSTRNVGRKGKMSAP